jgi:hypothetical protein
MQPPDVWFEHPTVTHKHILLAPFVLFVRERVISNTMLSFMEAQHKKTPVNQFGVQLTFSITNKSHVRIGHLMSYTRFPYIFETSGPVSENGVLY